MKNYLRVFVNFDQDDLARLILMTEFAYNLAENTSTGYTSLKLNYRYYLQVSYKKDVNLRSQSRSVDELATKFRKLMIIYRKNFLYTKELQKQYHDKNVKLKSYVPDRKV